MAKTRRRKRQRGGRNFVAIPFSASVALLTLADNTAVVAGLTAVLGEDLYVISVDGLWALRGAAGGEGPVYVGYAHGDLTVTEVKEALEAEVTDPDDLIARERARRPVRRSGIFPVLGSAPEVLKHGEAVRTPCKFSVGNDHALNLYAMNVSGATLTTGQIVECHGTIFGRWQR